MYLVSILCFFMVFWPYLELVLFNQAYQGVLPSMIPLEQSSAHWKETTKKLQLVIYNPIRPNVQAKLDLKWPQMTFTYLIHSSKRSRNKRKNNFYFSKNVFGQSLRCISDFINRVGVLWVCMGFYGVFIGQSWG